MGDNGGAVYFMRHAQTYGNSRGPLNGTRRNLGLTSIGKIQAREAARKMRIKPALILCSTQKRAVETARQIAKRFGSKIVYLPLLKEQDTGDWTGKRVDSLQKRYPDAFIKNGKKMTRIFYKAPNGENIGKIEKRARKIMWLAKNKYKARPLLIVSHGVIGRMLYYVAGKKNTLGAAMECKVPNAKLLRLKV